MNFTVEIEGPVRRGGGVRPRCVVWRGWEGSCDGGGASRGRARGPPPHPRLSSLARLHPPPATCFPPQETYTVNPDANAKGDRPSPYKGGLFRVAIKVPDSYPAEAPEVRCGAPPLRAPTTQTARASIVLTAFAFVPCVPRRRLSQVAFQTRVWHPQVAPESGKPCVDFLKEQWKPTHGLRDVLVMLRQLLGSPSQSECGRRWPGGGMGRGGGEAIALTPTLPLDQHAHDTHRHPSSAAPLLQPIALTAPPPASWRRGWTCLRSTPPARPPSLPWTRAGAAAPAPHCMPRRRGVRAWGWVRDRDGARLLARLAARHRPTTPRRRGLEAPISSGPRRSVWPCAAVRCHLGGGAAR
jgi:ubiquitin-protein ligase